MVFWIRVALALFFIIIIGQTDLKETSATPNDKILSKGI
jgi:hypothetical protein